METNDIERIVNLFTPPFNSETKYWLGFILADGCNTNTCLSIGLKLSDYEHLEKFTKFIGITGHIYYAKDRPAVQFTVCSKALTKQLSGIGITPKKSLTAKHLIGLEDDYDFWRGMVDGDGYLGFNKTSPRIALNGTKDIAQTFADFSVRTIPMHSSWRKPKISIFKSNAKCFQFNVIGYRAKDIVTKLYYPGCISLNRKQKIANKIIGESNVQNKIVI